MKLTKLYYAKSFLRFIKSEKITVSSLITAVKELEKNKVDANLGAKFFEPFR
ncbi:MAG: type II toxin-antitoxin system RelE/ParE family toxin [Candidatus Caenarcaniphilales bacterium]|nr:type II toxin-antitoxin system RelE/ParE family toxin [Candidatus Caenarcaniphilales bacterium]